MILVLLLLSSPALAKDSPDFITLGGGEYDFDKDQARRQSVDYRLEYEWGASLFPKSVNRFTQLHPVVGIEGNTRGALYGNGGLDLDVPFLRHGIFTWGEAVGAFHQGNDPEGLGSIAQFRSQLELGWRFHNNVRVTGYVSHISNADVANFNPGAEIAGVYLHIPTSGLGKK